MLVEEHKFSVPSTAIFHFEEHGFLVPSMGIIEMLI
jgi:hypothetical protein